MGKKQQSFGPGNRRSDSAPQRGGKSFNSSGEGRPPRREGGDFQSRPPFGRPSGKPSFGGRPGGDDRRFGSGPDRRGGDERRGGGSSFNRFGGGDNRGERRFERPYSKPRPAEPDDAADFMKGRFGKSVDNPESGTPSRGRFEGRERNDERGNGPRRPARNFGDERRPYGGAGAGRFDSNRFGSDRREEGADRPVRPARYEDRRDKRPERGDAPRFGREERRGGAERFDRSADSGSRFGNKGGRFERPERSDRFDDRRNFGGSDRFGSDRREEGADRPVRPARYEDRRSSARPERPATPRFGDKARGPRREWNSRSESMGEAPSYHNLKHYEEDKNRGNKRRRDEPETDGSIRLNRYIANAGICSRREADVLIESGEIRVNGEVVTELGYKVMPSDTVHYGKTNLKREKQVYVLLNKHKDFLTTTDDPDGRKTVMDLVKNASKERIFPVGRLDRNTTGLLLFTNDGEVAQKLSHPSHRNKKVYQVELDKPLTEEHLGQIAAGLELEDGKAEVDDVAVVAGNAKFVGIEIHIGRNRIVRRIFEHLGYDVKSLDRVQYAGLTKKDLPRGEWRYLTEKEVIRLKYFM